MYFVIAVLGGRCCLPFGVGFLFSLLGKVERYRTGSSFGGYVFVVSRGLGFLLWEAVDRKRYVRRAQRERRGGMGCQSHCRG